MRRATILARRQRQKRNERIALAASIVLLLAAFFIYKNVVGKSAVGTVKYHPLAQQATSSIATAQQVIAQGNYIKFSYPSSFRQIPTDIPKTPQLETFDFMTKSAPFWELAMGVSQLPGGNLRDDGSYNMRFLNPEKYKLEKLDINGQSIAVFSDSSEGFAKAAFIQHSDMLLSVALTGSGDTDTMQNQYKQILQSIEWVK